MRIYKGTKDQVAMISQLPDRLLSKAVIFNFNMELKMIPKRVFCMWCGSQKPIDVQNCILSWHKILPDYEIIEINEQQSQYFDFEKERMNNPYFDFLYQNKIWAYVSDYVRIKLLEKYGGIWLDTDITIVKPFDNLLNNGMFFGRDDENKNHIETAVIGSIAHHQVLKDLLKFYENEFWKSDLYTGPRITTEILKRHGFDFNQKNLVKFEDITIYPPEYFYPFPCGTKFKNDCLTSNTIAIHWWKASWNRLEVTNWLKNKHKIKKEKALSINLEQTIGLYLFSFIRIGTYYPNSNKISILGIKTMNIKHKNNRHKLYLFNFIPLLKWR